MNFIWCLPLVKREAFSPVIGLFKAILSDGKARELGGLFPSQCQHLTPNQQRASTEAIRKHLQVSLVIIVGIGCAQGTQAH